MISNRRHIAHMDLDSFFVSVELLRNSGLRGKPVLIGADSVRGVVASCSYEARRFGIHSAMSMKMAKRLCPHATIIRGDMQEYSRYSRLVTDIIRDTVPLFEKSSIDEFYVDMTGMEKYFGCLQFTAQLKEKVAKESGLTISYGLASNKLIGKVATGEVKPNGQIEIPFGSEKDFLAPLGIGKIPGIGKQTASVLMQRGVETVKKLSEIPVEMLQNLFGKNGRELWRRANGIDDTPVVSYHEQKSISTENTFSRDMIDIDFLHSEIVRMTEKIAFELRKNNRVTGCVTVKLKYSNFETVTKQITVPYTSADHVLIKIARALFDKLHDKRMLIRLLGIRFSHLIPGTHQIELFDDAAESTKLYQAIDSVKNRFGEKAVRKAGGGV